MAHMAGPAVDSTILLKPTLHIEVAVKAHPARPDALRYELREWIAAKYSTVKVGQKVKLDEHGKCLSLVDRIDVADYTGPVASTGTYELSTVELDLQTYVLKADGSTDERRNIAQTIEDEVQQARILELPNITLKDEWDSLVFDDALPSQLLRYLTRMVGMMKQPGLNLAAFNWNRLCLLHGPPGSGKSTLCRALAQKLSIRLGDAFPRATLVEINTNAMLSKYFGESGKLIGATFERIYSAAQDPGSLICVVMDEVETIAGSRERSTSGSECNDGLRATNQLLTALDRLRHLPNVIVLCTSNLIGAIDQAFLDRVDIKQLIPSPSPAAIYNIFRSCLNELIRSSLVDPTVVQTTRPKPTTRGSSRLSAARSSTSPNKAATNSKTTATSSSPEKWTVVSVPEVPSFSEVQLNLADQPQSAGSRVWALTQCCQGFSGRTLRRLPILGLAMYTWGSVTNLDDAISALEAAVDQELKVVRVRGGDVQMRDVQ